MCAIAVVSRASTRQNASKRKSTQEWNSKHLLDCILWLKCYLFNWLNDKTDYYSYIYVTFNHTPYHFPFVEYLIFIPNSLREKLPYEVSKRLQNATEATNSECVKVWAHFMLILFRNDNWRAIENIDLGGDVAAITTFSILFIGVMNLNGCFSRIENSFEL